MIEAVLELENKIFNRTVKDKDLEIEKISREHNVKSKDLEPYYELLENYRIVSLNLKMTLQKRIVWNKEERLIIDYYIKNTGYSKTEKFKHLSRILSITKRTKESISNDYYINVAPKEKQKNLRVLIKNKTNKKEDIFIKDINKSNSILSNSISENGLLENNVVLVDNKLEKPEKVDFLSNLSDFINNAKNLSNFNLEEFFHGMTLLTSLAANKVIQVNETEELNLKIKEQEKMIESLNAEILILNNDIEMISNETIEFVKLDGIDKIGKMKEFIDKLIELTK